MKTMPNDQIQLLSVKETAGRLRVSERFVWQAIASGELRTVKLGRRRLVPLANVATFIERNMEGTR